MKPHNLTDQDKARIIQHAIALIAKGMAENTYQGIALPNLPEKTIAALKAIQADPTEF